jgi:hypothetical protein
MFLVRALHNLPRELLKTAVGCLVLAACAMAIWLSAGSTHALVQNSLEKGTIPATFGWWEVPSTQMQSVCPENGFKGSGYPFRDSCHNVAAAWGGGVADTAENRLIVWGGGHSDYSGNEVYSLDLSKLTVTRLSDPGLPLASDCSETVGDATPNSRHTYDGLVFMPKSKVMLSFGGSLAPTGCASKAAWKLDLKRMQWDELKPSGLPPNYSGGVVSAHYDPVSHLVFVSTQSYGSFASYDADANSYRLLNSHAVTDYHETGAIDPGRRLYFLFGGGFAHKIDISGRDQKYQLESLQAKGCEFVKAVYPGVDYDESRHALVGWSGGDRVDIYDPDTDSCSSKTYPNGPGPQQANGTGGRFRYFPQLGVFGLVNSFTQNAYVLRMEPEKAIPPAGSGIGGNKEGERGKKEVVTERRRSAAGTGKSADDDFKERCHAPGVIKCIGWDSPGDFAPAHGGGGYADGLYPASDGTFQGTMDTSVKISGGGSLKFTVRPYVTANGTGYWRANFGSLGNLNSFGPHTTLYLQFRLRLDANMLDFPWNKVSNEGWKVFIVYGPIPGPSCTGAQFVQENTYQTNVATAYTSCGSPALYTNNGKPPMFIEQGDYKCPYNSGGYQGAPCFHYPADKWITEYWVVEIGDYGLPNTHFTAYIGVEGKPLKRFIDLPNFVFNKGADPSEGLQSILLQPYMSGADGTKNNPTAHMWFDELIISKQPIAAPAN